MTNRFHYGWVIVIGGFLSMVCFGSSRYLYGYVLPTMEVELNLPHEPMGNIASAYFFTYGVTAFVWGIIADRIGTRKCMLLGLIILSVGLAGMGTMSSLPVGLLSYLLCGTGAGGIYVPLAALISAWFGGERRGRAFGIALTGGGVLTTIAGLVVPIILASYSWRWIWWSASALALVVAAICWFLLVNTPAEKGFAPVGANGGKQPTSVEKHNESKAPIGRKVTLRDVLRRGTVWNLAGVWFTYGMGYVVFITFAVAYLREIGWGIEEAARGFATFGLMSIPGPPFWGTMADRITKKYLLMCTLALQSVGAFLLLGGSVVGGYLGAGLVGFGTVGMPVLLGSAMADYYEPEIIGTTLGFIILFLGISSVVAPTLAGALADRMGTLSPAILLSLSGYVLAFLLILMLKKPPKRY